MSTARYCKEWRLDTARNGLRRVPVGPAAERVRHWAGLGYSHQQIADTTGVSRSHISDLIDGQFTRVRRDIAHKILTAELSNQLPSTLGYINATGTRRRLQALLYIGHTIASIAVATGHRPEHLSRIISGQYQALRPATVRSIRSLYRTWCAIPGRSVRSRNRARQLGWAGPLAWDDNDIDNPAATPEAEPNDPALNRDELAALRLTEIRHLAGYGTPADEIAARLGISVKRVNEVIGIQTGRWKIAA